MMRIILIAIAVVIIGAVGVTLYVLSAKHELIQEAVETYGSEIIKGKVTLDSVEIDLISGKATLRGFTVGNPAGFDTPNAFSLGAVSVAIDVGTLTGDTIIIKEIIIDKPVVTYEIGDNGSNIDAIQRNVESYMSRFGGGQSSASNDSGGSETKLIVEDLYIRGGAVNVSAGFLGGKSMGAALPDIHLEDIGKESDGVLPEKIAEIIITAITDGTTSAVSGLGLEALQAEAGKMIEGIASDGASAIMDATKDSGKTVEKIIGEGALEGLIDGKAIEGAAESATKALGNLFGGSSN